LSLVSVMLVGSFYIADVMSEPVSELLAECADVTTLNRFDYKGFWRRRGYNVGSLRSNGATESY
jgi:hypothetical protein